jgi:Flp pilus assembly protein TadG
MGPTGIAGLPKSREMATRGMKPSCLDLLFPLIGSLPGRVKEAMKIGRMGRNNKGATVVEFAIVSTVFFIFIFGILDLGRYFFVEHTLQFATREGVRLALVGNTLTDASGNCLSREASIIKAIKDNASSAVDPSKLNISIFPVQSDYSDPKGWQEELNAGEPGDYMRVRTRYTFDFLTPLIATFFSKKAIEMQAEATYRNELFDK